MFSVTKTGMNFRPLWTAKVKPTMSGMMVDRLDQVLMTFLSPCSTARRTFRARLSSTYGPFLIDRATEVTPCSFISDALRCRGRKPCSCGSCAPWSAFPTACRDASPRRISPPPAERVVHRVHGHAPSRRPPAEPAAPAGLPERHLLVVQVPHLPHRRHAIDEYEPHLPGPEAQVGVLPLLRENLDDVARRTCQLPPLAHLELHVVDHRPHRDLADRKGVARLDIRVVAGNNRVSHGEPHRGQDVPFFPVCVMQEGDAGRPVRVVFDRGDLGGDVLLVSPEVDHPVFSLVCPPAVPGRDSPLVVPARTVFPLLDETPLRLLLGEVLVRENRHGADAGGGRLEFFDSHVLWLLACLRVTRLRKTRSCRPV